ncbi:tRNA (adenosine(37)-N6)-threonylcarbamoyltransferase complex dimerization subunit type 1 TsaB [Cesiribacter sp. SM1]|uniref:tRNA (adenosine(37)-N6)-threonylcarbamoyltransferase complex dimerization subunit type 1 TsaB n=1 Tax=Cesiribacter sp. SM1 TaxID=2861196 RepID=UPI001CD6EF4B|nr:tRNA (adenosine(37)-N6)-threonylcarbamoyltransferase complex dimerization subunit type 1 TsaB [Cesiribacter sp. SM1]
MAYILSIETATKVCSVALHQDGVLVVSQHLHIDKSHSGLLTVLIHNSLQYAGIAMSDIAAVAVSAGPGSYTGLRIGTSTAKGLCYALEVPLIAVNTLEAMAHEVATYAPANALLCPMIDARRMEVYCMLQNKQGEIIEPQTPKVIDAHSFEEELQQQIIYFFGDGAAKCKEVLGYQPNAHFVSGVVPSAVPVGALAHQRWEQQQFEDLAYFEPVYLKEFQGTKPKTLV